MPKSAPSHTLNYSKHKLQQSHQEESKDAAAVGLISSSPAPLGSAFDSDTVKVVVRIRPQPSGGDQGVALNAVGNAGVQLSTSTLDGPHTFSFDHVAKQTATQSDIFSVAGIPIVENCLKGYNGCVMAYGQTGSGKTYSMLGKDGVYEDRGLIQRIFERIFEHAEQHKSDTMVSVSCSFLEIYNEQVGDLLSSSSSRLGLPIREDGRSGSTYVEGMSVHKVKSIQDVVQLLSQGTANRKTGETAMNERSSRSHSIFIATIEQQRQQKTTNFTTTTRSRLYLVDLAGSERQKATGTAGDRLREAASINKSLSALGHVIMSLVDQRQGRRHIPYRDSKLTFLLQEALGGNSRMVMLACVSPSTPNAAETLSTLRFANGAKRIKIHATSNESYDANNDTQLLRAEIKRLKDQLQAEVNSGLSNYASQRVLVDALRREREAKIEIERLRRESSGLEELVAAKEADTQRLSMMVKLKEARLASLVARGATQSTTDAVLNSMKQEIDMLQAALSQKSNSEVRRFAVENMQLRHQLARWEAFVEDDTKQTTLAQKRIAEEELSALRDEMLRTAEALDRAEAETTLLRETLEEERKERSALCCNDTSTDTNTSNNIESALRLEASEAAARKEKKEAERLCAYAAQLESRCESLERSLKSVQDDEEWFVQAVLGELVECWNQASNMERSHRAERCRMVEAFEKKIEELKETSRKEIVAAEIETSEAKEALKRVRNDLEMCKSKLQRVQEGREELEEALARADDTRVDLEYRLSDVSAELAEVKQRNSALVASTRELAASRLRVTELEEQLAEARVAAQAAVGPLERQREVNAVRDELRVAQAALEVVREEVAALAGVVKKKDEELARLKADMAAEVNDAALQVQELLLAQERAEAAEARVRELEEGRVMEGGGGV